MFVYPAVAITACILGPNRLQRAPNVQRKSWLSDEDEFLSTRLSARQIHQLALEYIWWHRQVDGADVRYYISTEHVKLFLHYLARGGYYHQVARAEGLAESLENISVYHLHIYRVPRK